MMMRQHEPERPNDVGSSPQKDLPFHQRLADQPELVVLEIAQPTVDELRRCGGGRTREIAFFAEEDLQSPAGCIAGDAASIDAAADDREVECPRPSCVACHVSRLL